VEEFNKFKASSSSFSPSKSSSSFATRADEEENEENCFQFSSLRISPAEHQIMAEPDRKRWENEQQEAIQKMKLKCGGRERKT
jgi:hypothetical protein